MNGWAAGLDLHVSHLKLRDLYSSAATHVSSDRHSHPQRPHYRGDAVHGTSGAALQTTPRSTTVGAALCARPLDAATRSPTAAAASPHRYPSSPPSLSSVDAAPVGFQCGARRSHMLRSAEAALGGSISAGNSPTRCAAEVESVRARRRGDAAGRATSPCSPSSSPAAAAAGRQRLATGPRPRSLSSHSSRLAETLPEASAEELNSSRRYFLEPRQ